MKWIVEPPTTAGQLAASRFQQAEGLLGNGYVASAAIAIPLPSPQSPPPAPAVIPPPALPPTPVPAPAALSGGITTCNSMPGGLLTTCSLPGGGFPDVQQHARLPGDDLYVSRRDDNMHESARYPWYSHISLYVALKRLYVHAGRVTKCQAAPSMRVSVPTPRHGRGNAP
jgi:hypothetical protein